MKRKSAPVSNSPQKPKCTILNAVPSAKTIQMTPLEEEMATSPNEEILSALSGPGSPTHFAFTGSNQQVSSIQQSSRSKNRSPVKSTQRTRSERRKENDTRIGVWVDGIAHWDDEGSQNSVASKVTTFEEQTGFSPLAPVSTARLNGSQTKPRLSVVIPTGEPLINDTTLSTIVQPTPHRPVISVAPANLVTKFGLSSSNITIPEPGDVSPLESALRNTAQAQPPPIRPNAPHRISSQSNAFAIKSTSRSSTPSSPISSDEPDSCSEYSQRSSATSVDVLAANTTPEKAKKALKIRKRPAYLNSDAAPPAATVVDEEATGRPDVNKPLPPSPIPPPQRAAPPPPPSPSSTYTRESVINARSASMTMLFSGGKEVVSGSRRAFRPSTSLSQLDSLDLAFLRSAPSFHNGASPTLSEAADDLEAHLSNIADDCSQVEEASSDGVPFERKACSVERSDSVRSIMQPPERAPTIPRRSRKREWRTQRNGSRAVQSSKSQAPSRRQSDATLHQKPSQEEEVELNKNLKKSKSAVDLTRLPTSLDSSLTSPKDAIPPTPKIVINDGLGALHDAMNTSDQFENDPSILAGSAEEVLLHILSSLTRIEDLFSTAQINKGMHRVYKENEMDLIRRVTYNQSPAASEFRKWCPPERNNTDESKASSEQVEHTPLSYMRCYRRDMNVIESLKGLILEHCQTFIRRETAFALSTPTHPHAQRFNDAFWRIWCFCKIFGCDKGREEDVTGQLDWLKGGLLANNQDLTATMNMNLEFDMASVLVNPPEFFAKGNAGGLSAQQLYDMSEIWSCLTTLLSGYHSRVEQAFHSGMFDDFEPSETVESEEQALEEWTAYLLSLGPSVVLEMAQFAYDDNSAGSALAKVNGWTKWAPEPTGGSRTSFLKEPVARLYEERVAAAAHRLQNPREHEMKELSRKRVANLAAEIKLARQASYYKRLPLIDMSMERSMSVMTRQNSTMSTRSIRNPSSAPARTSLAPTLPPRPPNFSVPHPKSPPPNLWAPRKISPIIEDRVETFNRMSLQNFAAGVAEDTSDRAVKRIVDMGFSAAQAREALRMTDLGDGLRVDRAVDMLLQRQQ